ncbi:hypothetical protein [Paracoccus mutanolyticus]|nr:hypothetical protein [Paracoccus mutanolyticus]
MGQIGGKPFDLDGLATGSRWDFDGLEPFDAADMDLFCQADS